MIRGRKQENSINMCQGKYHNPSALSWHYIRRYACSLAQVLGLVSSVKCGPTLDLVLILITGSPVAGDQDPASTS